MLETRKIESNEFTKVTNPFIDMPVPKYSKKKEASRKRNMPDMPLNQPADYDRQKAQEVENYKPLFKKLHEENPIQYRY